MINDGKLYPSFEELIATIERSSLPTVVVEGNDDMIVYRHIETCYADSNVSVMPVGGRPMVLKLFDYFKKSTTTSRICFIADRDLWIIEEVPNNYISNLLILTSGYSIENDIFCDGKLLSLMSSQEIERFKLEMALVVKWYAISVNRYLSGGEYKFNIHPSALIENASFYDRCTALLDGEVFPEALVQKIQSEYDILLRGKTLFDLLLRQISHSSREIKHSRKSIMEFMASMRGPKMNDIFTKVGSNIS